MKVDDSQPTFVEKQDNCQTEISPKSIKEFFDCEQYKLAMSGFSTPIILILINNPKLHQQLLECMLLLDSSLENSIDKQEQGYHQNLPFRIFELFSNFQDVYTNYMFGFNSGIQLENNGKQLLLKMFQVFNVKGEVNQTVIGYLYRIIDQVLTRNDGNLLFNFLNQHIKVRDSIINHIETPSATNIIIKSFESGLEEILPQQKVEVVKNIYFNSFKTMNQGEKDANNIIQGLKYFTEKLLDKSTVRKIGSNHLSEYILSKQIVNLICEVLLENKYIINVHINCLEIIVILLKQFKAPDTTPAKSRGSINKSSRHFGKCLTKVKLIQLIPESIQTLRSTIQKILAKIVNNDCLTDTKCYLLAFTQVLQLMAIYTPEQLKSVISKQSIIWLIENMEKLPFCNLYHASVKQIMLVVLSDQELFQKITNQQPFNLLKFLYTYFIQRNKSHCFESCLFEIIKQIYTKIDGDVLSEIIQKLKFEQEWKQIIEKYEKIKQRRKRRYEDASQQEVNQEESKVRVKSIGQDVSLPQIKILTIDQKTGSTAQTSTGSQTSCQSPSKNQYSLLMSPPNSQNMSDIFDFNGKGGSL